MTLTAEPTGRRVAIVHRTASFGAVRIYGPLRGGAMTCSGDTVVINGHTLTDDELRRGWYDAAAETT